MKYCCAHCFYVYDEQAGEPDCDIKPNTPLGETPPDFECPLCHTGKDAFLPQNNYSTNS